jgi:antitoxin component YwqK of YwqJK toxin-antitoxin module
MKLVCLICLLMIARAASACVCGPLPELKSKENLSGYDFIALVKIKELAPLDTMNGKWPMRKNGDISVEVIELFKGEKTGMVVDPSVNSSCGFGLAAGEQWLFFGNMYDGKVNISTCSYSIRYADRNGLRNWADYSGIKQLDILRSIYNHRVEVGEQIKYANGNIEVNQLITNGQLDGVRKVFYPTGVLYIEEKFKDGKRVGYKKVYGPSGQLLSHITYRKGLVNKVVHYQDTSSIAEYLLFRIAHPDYLNFSKNPSAAPYIKTLDSLRRKKNWAKEIKLKFTYAGNGRSYTRRFYDDYGRLAAKGYLDWYKQLNEHWMYYETGKIKMYSKLDKKNNQQIEYDYKEDGSRRDFVKPCESCKYYFDPGALPEATPEKGYIQ